MSEVPKNFGMLELIRLHLARAAATLSGSAATAAIAAGRGAAVAAASSCPCSDEPHVATQFCVECGDDLCDAYAATHRRARGTAGHTLVPQADKVRPSVAVGAPIYCRVHARQELVSYCSTCAQPICVVCGMETHAAHTKVGVAVVGAEKRVALEALAARAATTAGALLEQADTIEVGDIYFHTIGFRDSNLCSTLFFF